MALLDDDDLLAMTLAIGDDTLATYGTGELAIVYRLSGPALLDGELIDHQGPYALAVTAEVEALGIVAGNDGDTLTIGGVDYTVLAIRAGRGGMAVLTLHPED